MYDRITALEDLVPPDIEKPVRKKAKPKRKRARVKRKKSARSNDRVVAMDRTELYIEALSRGLSQSNAARLIKVKEATVQKWKNEDVNFRRRVDEARARFLYDMAGRAVEMTTTEGCKNEGIRLAAIWNYLRILGAEFKQNKKDPAHTAEEMGSAPSYEYL